MFSIILLEHFLGFSGSDGYVYPVIGDAVGDAIQRRVKKYGNIAIKWVREAFEEINEETIKRNVSEGLEEPLVDCDKVVLYTARHSFASAYLNSEGATVRGAASLLSRSANTISVYIHALQNDKDIADAVSFLDD
jgi:site-specific recombinase XerD